MKINSTVFLTNLYLKKKSSRVDIHFKFTCCSFPHVTTTTVQLMHKFISLFCSNPFTCGKFPWDDLLETRGVKIRLSCSKNETILLRRKHRYPVHGGPSSLLGIKALRPNTFLAVYCMYCKYWSNDVERDIRNRCSDFNTACVQLDKAGGARKTLRGCTFPLWRLDGRAQPRWCRFYFIVISLCWNNATNDWSDN